MAQNKLKYAPTSNAFQTSLNGAISATATTIILNSVTGLQNKAGILVIDRVDSNGTATPSAREYIYFTGVSGSSVTLPSVADGRGQGGSTGQSHADGAIVEAIIDVDQWNGFVDSYATQHNDNGTHTTITTDRFSASSLVSISSSLFVAGVGAFPSLASVGGRLDARAISILSLASLPASSIPSNALVEPFLRGRYQSDTTDTAPTGLTLQFGWGYMVGSGTDDMGETVTFPTAFSAAPIVLVTSLMARLVADGTPNGPGWFTVANVSEVIGASATAITTTNFSLKLNRSDAAIMANTNNYGYTWIAIGTVA